jgi:hypothetical protein
MLNRMPKPKFSPKRPSNRHTTSYPKVPSKLSKKYITDPKPTNRLSA